MSENLDNKVKNVDSQYKNCYDSKKKTPLFGCWQGLEEFCGNTYESFFGGCL